MDVVESKRNISCMAIRLSKSGAGMEFNQMYQVRILEFCYIKWIISIKRIHHVISQPFYIYAFFLLQIK